LTATLIFCLQAAATDGVDRLLGLLCLVSEGWLAGYLFFG
jgi:hypothetical protein